MPRSDAQVSLSMILQWYQSDFATDARGVLRWIEEHLSPDHALRGPLAALLALPAESLNITYRQYDWSLNGL